MTELSPQAVAAITEYANRLIRVDPPIPLLGATGDFPFIARALEQHFIRLKKTNELRLPDLSLGNETVAVFSDYGGEHPESKCRTYSFLLVSYNSLRYFEEAMAEIRVKNGLNEPYKEIAFKDLSYGPLRRSLDDYLRILNNLVPGFLVTVIIDKDIANIFTTGTDGVSPVEALRDAGLGDWPPKEAERLLRIVHAISYLVSVLAKGGQKLLWITDNDSIVGNESRKIATGVLLRRLLDHYSNNKYPTVGMATPFADASYLDDLLSATDLISGAVEHYFSRVDGTAAQAVRDDVNKILVWMAYEGVSLRRDVVRIRKAKPGDVNALEVATVSFMPTEQAKNVITVAISQRREAKD
jgi:hypothetical protein